MCSVLRAGEDGAERREDTGNRDIVGIFQQSGRDRIGIILLQHQPDGVVGNAFAVVVSGELRRGAQFFQIENRFGVQAGGEDHAVPEAERASVAERTAQKREDAGGYFRLVGRQDDREDAAGVHGIFLHHIEERG